MGPDRDMSSRRAEAAADLEQSQPLLPGMVEQFSRLMMRPHSDADQHGRQGRDWLKEHAFRFAERVLLADNATREIRVRDDEDRRQQDSSDDEGQGQGEGSSAGATSGQSWRKTLLRICRRIVEARAMGDLAAELNACIQQTRHFGSAWQLEIVLSGAMIAGTRLTIRCDSTALSLRFACPNQLVRAMLENNATGLRNRLAAVTAHAIAIDIEDVPASAPASRPTPSPVLTSSAEGNTEAGA